MISVEEALKLSRRETIELHRSYLNPTLVSMFKLLDFDKRFVRAGGAYVWDEDGNKYLDFLAGYGSLNVGHNHPRVIEAVGLVEDAPNLLQTSLNPVTGALASNLSVITPGRLKHCFFCNSGAEAVESALKMARAATGRHQLIHTEGAFHGKTMGALSVSGREKYKKVFRPLVGGIEAVPFGDIELLEARLKYCDAAAFILEPVQGEGGIVVPPDGYLKHVEKLCRKYGTLLILDEVQTGMGRTGAMFACEHEHVVPDILVLSKSLGGGLMPIGACVTTEQIWKRAYGGFDKALLHTSTFGGNTRACAAAIAAIDVIISEDLPAKAAKNGEYMLSKLRALQLKHTMIKEVRGKGLLIGIEFREPFKGYLDKLSGGLVNQLYKEYFASLVASQLLNKHKMITAFTLNNPNVLRLEPPLNIAREDIDLLIDAIDEVCKKNRSPVKTVIRAGRTTVGRVAAMTHKKSKVKTLK
jgi:putrescine aminotransferase